MLTARRKRKLLEHLRNAQSSVLGVQRLLADMAIEAAPQRGVQPTRYMALKGLVSEMGIPLNYLKQALELVEAPKETSDGS